MRKLGLALLFFFLSSFVFVPVINAGYVNGYYNSNGSYVSGYYRTEPDAYKWNNYSFDNDWSDAYNDNTWYRNYGYDPEPYDNDYVSSYSTDYYYYNYYYSYDSYDYYDSYDSYDSYSGWDWNW